METFPNPSTQTGRDTRSIFKQSFTGLNLELSLQDRLPYQGKRTQSTDQSIAGGRIVRLIPSPRVLGLYEMQIVSFRIWTRVDVSISYDDND